MGRVEREKGKEGERKHEHQSRVMMIGCYDKLIKVIQYTRKGRVLIIYSVVGVVYLVTRGM